MNDFGKQLGDIFSTIATVLILLLPLALIFFIVRNALALKREMKETKELEAARAEEQRRAVLQRQEELESMEDNEEAESQNEESPGEDTQRENEENK